MRATKVYMLDARDAEEFYSELKNDAGKLSEFRDKYKKLMCQLSDKMTEEQYKTSVEMEVFLLSVVENSFKHMSEIKEVLS